MLHHCDKQTEHVDAVALNARYRSAIQLVCIASMVMLSACSTTSTNSVREASNTELINAVVEPGAASNGSSTVTINRDIEANLDDIPERVLRNFERAIAAMRSGNWLDAELELQQLILDEPGFPGAYVNLAIIYQQDGRSADARAALEQALAISPGFPPANNQLGKLLREQGEFAQAEAAYRKAIEADPGYAAAHYNLGILLDVYMRKSSEALTHYSLYQASQAQPDETVARWIVDLERRTRTAAERVAQD